MAVIAAGDGPGESSAQFNGFFLRPLFFDFVCCYCRDVGESTLSQLH